MDEIIEMKMKLHKDDSLKISWKFDRNERLSFILQELKSLETSESLNTFLYHLCQLCENCRSAWSEEDQKKEDKCNRCIIKHAKS